MENLAMKKIGKFLFDTWYGAVAACAVSATGVLAGTLFGVWTAGQIVQLFFVVLLLLSGLTLVAAFVRSLWKKAWGRAAVQLGIGVVGAVGFVMALIATFFASAVIALALGWRGKWIEPEKNGVVPFEVEYRVAHPFLAEYDRRVAFASGKRVGIAMDTGGLADLTVYALGDDSYALMDRARNLFRVDAANETVDAGAGRKWFRLPDGTLDIIGRGGDGVEVRLEGGKEKWVEEGVPFGETLDGRRMLGKFVPYGRFEAATDDDDWLAEVPWETLPGWPEELPFALEWRKERGLWGNEEWQLAFASGKTVPMRLGGMTATLHETADGNYVLEEKKDGPGVSLFQETYRIRPGDERLDQKVYGAWVEWPEGLREYKGTSWLRDGSRRCVEGLDENGNEVKGTNSVPVNATMEGMRLVGRVSGDRKFERAGAGDVGAEGDAE